MFSLRADPRLGSLCSSSDEVRDASWRRLYDEEAGRVARLVSRHGVAPADVRNVGAWLGGIAVRTAADHRR
jgi:hypothetical protein